MLQKIVVAVGNQFSLCNICQVIRAMLKFLFRNHSQAKDY